MDAGQTITVEGFAQLLRLTYIPEKTDKESAVIFDWLRLHAYEYSALAFSVHVGQGTTPDPTHLVGVQATTQYSSQKRIDILAWQGTQPYIGEAKYRLGPAALGQLHTYALLWTQEHPYAAPPLLFAVGRYSDPDTLAVLYAHHVTVYLIAEPPGSGGPVDRTVPLVDAPPAA